MVVLEKEPPLPGPYQPTLILHGGAGNIIRKNLPPALYHQYEASLLKYLDSTRQWLFSGASALDAAVHAVSLMEDDPLFNCGRGSVFTEKGTIEMEASVMVASVDPDRGGRDSGSMAAEGKRGASVSLVRNTKHPIQLAREVLLVEADGRASSMHCQLSGPEVEEWGWKERRLERKDDDWFWTKRRWAEHLRGLKKHGNQCINSINYNSALEDDRTCQRDEGDDFLPSQGTVGAVCMDSWGDLAVATSTGGLTNKKVGRIGDTPTLGAGFWTESWEEAIRRPNSAPTFQNPHRRTDYQNQRMRDRLVRAIEAGFGDVLAECFPHVSQEEQREPSLSIAEGPSSTHGPSTEGVIGKQTWSSATPKMEFGIGSIDSKPVTWRRRRATALSGTGNGDTFLRTAACRTTAAICRFANQDPTSMPLSLATAMNMMAGPEGEMQRSAGDRWKVTGEGEAGMIGIEVYDDEDGATRGQRATDWSQQPRRSGKIVFGFNCGGLWRAWIDEATGRGKVMVFKNEYR